MPNRLSLVNKLRGLALDERTLRPLLAQSTGGHRLLKPVALAAVWASAAAVDLPIVGMGVVGSGQASTLSSRSRARAVALGTVLFSDPGAATRTGASSRRRRLRVGTRMRLVRSE